MRICFVVVAIFFLIGSPLSFAGDISASDSGNSTSNSNLKSKSKSNTTAVSTAIPSFPTKPMPLGLTVKQAIKKYGPDAKKRLLPCFEQANVPYPPDHLSLVCFKSEGMILVFARDSNNKMKQIRSYSIVSNSGVSGPKLKEGDLQIPEGFYKITGLDAMTHLAMWVNYPNSFDKIHAQTEHRANTGGYIQIHAGVYSTGCIVISNDDMAELFCVAHDVGYHNVDLLVAPCNLLAREPSIDFKKQPDWLPELYKQIKVALRHFPVTR
jgi:hypothetical protein